MGVKDASDLIKLIGLMPVTGGHKPLETMPKPKHSIIVESASMEEGDDYDSQSSGSQTDSQSSDSQSSSTQSLDSQSRTCTRTCTRMLDYCLEDFITNPKKTQQARVCPPTIEGNVSRRHSNVVVLEPKFSYDAAIKNALPSDEMSVEASFSS